MPWYVYTTSSAYQVSNLSVPLQTSPDQGMHKVQDSQNPLCMNKPTFRSKFWAEFLFVFFLGLIFLKNKELFEETVAWLYAMLPARRWKCLKRLWCFSINRSNIWRKHEKTLQPTNALCNIASETHTHTCERAHPPEFEIEHVGDDRGNCCCKQKNTVLD